MHLDVYTKTIYKWVVFCTIGEVFATGCFTFNYRQRYQEKITLFENGAFSKINKLLLVICISERQIERRGSGTSSVG